MKKTITTLLFLVLSFGLFAETGYAGVQWGTYKKSLKLTDTITPTESEIWDSTIAKKKTILGTITNVYYHFSEDYLYGVSYEIRAEKTKELQKKFNNPVITIDTETGTREDFVNTLLENGYIKDVKNNEVITHYANKSFFEVACILEFKGYDTKGKKGKGKIHIYDYNDDTRVYLFENIVENSTFVVYMWHEQDY